MDSQKVIPYLRVLGISENGKLLLSELSQNKKLNIITSVKQFIDDSKNSNTNRILKNMLEKDILATNIYTLGYKKNPDANLDYTKKIVVI